MWMHNRRRTATEIEVWGELSGHRGRTDPLTLLTRVRNKEAMDPRDKVFAVVGLSDVASQVISYPPPPEVDYNRPAGLVYRDVTRYIVQRSQNLDILLEAEDKQGLADEIFVRRSSLLGASLE